MSKLNELKDYLRKLNYPGINIMQDEQVADVFSKQNRLYFLTWFSQQWDTDLVLPIDQKDKVNILADFLCDNGFCTAQQNIKFVTDDFDLEPNEQLTIIYRMLYNLYTLNSEQETSDTCNINYSEEISILSKLDVNIFPELGPIQSRQPEERIQKFKEFQQEIEQLQEEIESFDEINESNLSDFDKNDFGSSDLLNHVSEVIHNSIFILEGRNVKDKGFFSQQFESIISDCCRNISHVLELHQNKKSIAQFTVACENLEEKSNVNYINDIMKRVSILSEEVLHMD